MASINGQLFERSQRLIPGGVNSPVRAFRGVGGTPVFLQRGLGAHVWDVDGKRYIDYVGSWGPLILGHAHSEVVAAIQLAAEKGTGFGAPTEAELQMAETLCALVPSMAQVRLTSSGTEATMSAIRLARGFTGRKLIVKFEGCYHGHGDALLVKAGSGALTCGEPDSAGVPPETAASTLVLSYNDFEAVEQAFRASGDSIAAIIVEPVAGNMNLVLPEPEFLPTLRALCTKHGAVLIFDEVMTGFRVALHGAQGLFGITPDLTTLGKVIGGGLPVGAFGGRLDIMQRLSPVGPVYQAGTLSGNPVALAAGLKTLELIQRPRFFEDLTDRTMQLIEGLNRAAEKHSIEFSAQSVGGMFGLYFRVSPPKRFAEVMQCDVSAFKRFFHRVLEQGIYLAPSAYEAGFVSSAHSEADIDQTLSAAERSFSAS